MSSLTLGSPTFAQEPPAEISLALSENSQDLAQAERLGQQLYLDGQFSAAIAQWQTIVEAHEIQQNVLAQVSALSNLSLSYQGSGQWEDAQTTVMQSLSLVNAYSRANGALLPHESLVKARTLMTQGSLQLSLGQTALALDSWRLAAEAYAQGDDAVGLNRAQINQAQALRELGFYRQALDQLLAVTESMAEQPPSRLKAIALRRLGEALRLSGQLSASQTALTESLTIAQQNNDAAEMSATLLSLGHTAQNLGDLAQAKTLYADAMSAIAPSSSTARSSSDPSLSVRLGLSVDALQQVPIEIAQLDLAIVMEDGPEIARLWSALQKQFSQLPMSRNTLYQQVNWATSLIKLLQKHADGSIEISASDLPSLHIIDQQLRQVTEQARRLGDRQAESYALGTLGHLYEFNRQWAIAQQLTERALAISKEENATDIVYQWQWQLGRLWKDSHNPARSVPRSIEAYTQSIEMLSSLRGDLSATDGIAQFSFQENVEPVYRQLVSLLLQTSPEASNYQKKLATAQNVIESLRLAELDNYFQEACVDVTAIDINQSDDKAAIVYTLVLEDRLSVLLHLPNQPIQHFSVAVSAQQVGEITQQLRQQLVIRSRRQYLDSAAQIYDWLIGPARTMIDQSEIETLVFVLDGPLQSVPMATLYDGEHFLIEDYSVALTPGLTLLNPRPWDAANLSALIAGVTESRQGLSSLPYVASEVEKIASNLDSHTVLLNQAFTQASLSKQLRSRLYPIVHVATHGQFGSTAEETFLLAWDSLINVRDVSQMLQANLGGREGIELLVLSACETASGDQRAALGLAGVAVKAGARSTVGSLWSVNDEVTSQFVGYFYEQLTQPGMSRASALRAAQLQLIRDPQYRHPIYWAPYILLGSWL
ncbi:MAG: CHAT domain-containing protein [Cyanobacteria bacterium J06621_11]